MYTIIETPLFSADAKDIWSEEERGDFCAWLAANPQAGDVIPGSGGCRKVRWARPGAGKRPGVRVIYFNRLENGVIHLLVIYAKAVRGNIPAHLLKAIRHEIEHDDEQA
ncbi:type II toxin-antitoxin system RelE/ParE family toxin [Comamonas sp. NLF-1-9]|uniref:type II toxin-antitoxin system RelE/ParE family toxin n=1 Tax=Comamonas sp. NLF-1-9 TaxID=2853163 RepID=UPI001C48EBCA|nr:type II toxin-antitoxin system RelE/ParE family toxin [Comamonas sp. NLF-1-9]QXL84132.1 type II toxin-antitoxin system RelE/ParE family toxin [Comamonas sp. NLF-1-9]